MVSYKSKEEIWIITLIIGDSHEQKSSRLGAALSTTTLYKYPHERFMLERCVLALMNFSLKIQEFSHVFFSKSGWSYFVNSKETK